MSGFSASKAQREKIAGEFCVVCGDSPCDPAHTIDRSLGGDDHPDCVVPLCRRHHRWYDEQGLDLLPFIGRVEQAYAVSLVGLEAAYRRLTNSRNPGGH